ncbi:uncharacterized protein BDR25DRAFT_326630 [Lindgomyces ingoldianus]|uniref:Uncharacterized protein n=1 Tax=Lindgomyces ingoldianus TaxID=673940 RepID=A0ACB6QPN9_9PLEO|nr:uncharacterized protein BDR25DRAFT_326630 [Lindgomyces ingoldianus]KAF2468989.1 hypothetical protein BDR25DRAFT_326630 [Lindgomyces ingoldianus]
MRLPYVPNPPTPSNEQDRAIIERVRDRRGDAGLLELDLALLHSPPVADGWNSFLGAIRTRTTLSTSIRETAICRVAVLNEAWFEWEHHAPLLRACLEIREEHGRLHILDEKHRAVVLYTDDMTCHVTVSDAVSDRLKASFSDREVVEITATIAVYNCVSRFLVALDVGECNGRKGPLVR